MNNSLPWYRNVNVWLQLASAVPAGLIYAGVAGGPVGVGISAAVSLGLAIYNASSHHAAVSGLDVAVAAAKCATDKLNAAGGQ